MPAFCLTGSEFVSNADGSTHVLVGTEISLSIRTNPLSPGHDFPMTFNLARGSAGHEGGHTVISNSHIVIRNKREA